MEKETKEETVQKTEEPTLSKKDKKLKEKYEEEISKLKADLEHWKNEYYRAYADTQNLRKSLEKDHMEAMKYRSMGFIESLLPVLDSFHSALANEPTEPALKNYLTGFQYVYRSMVSAMENEGVSEIAPQVGDAFNSDTMSAVDVVEDDGEENKVAKVFGNGYKLRDRLVRPAMVVVTKHKQDTEKTDA